MPRGNLAGWQSSSAGPVMALLFWLGLIWAARPPPLCGVLSSITCGDDVVPVEQTSCAQISGKAKTILLPRAIAAAIMAFVVPLAVGVGL